MKGERLVGGVRCGEVLADLSDYLDGTLSAARRGELESHLRGCDVCERFGGEFGADIAALRARLGAPEPLDAHLKARLRDRLRRDLGS